MAKQNKCRHFRSALEGRDCCAGVVYRSLGKGSQWPCHGDTGDNISVCQKYDPFTAEEVAQQQARQKEAFGFIGRAQALIDKSKSGGIIECPKCSGRFQWARASNGHTHGRCANCGIGWMQ